MGVEVVDETVCVLFGSDGIEGRAGKIRMSILTLKFYRIFLIA